MTRLPRNLKSFAALLAIAVLVSGAACAADLSEPVILVASSALDETPFQQTVVLATPLGDEGGHIGFIINKPTRAKLQELFPDDRAAANVKESVYLGGPEFLQTVFAVTRKPPPSAGAAVQLMPGLFAVMDSDSIDRIIATTPNEARFFLGMMVWKPGALEEEVRQSAWELRPPDVEVVLDAKSPGLWTSLRGSRPYI